jgi:hypothetical protein
MYGGSIVPGMQGPDRRPMTLRDLSPEDQRAYALRIMNSMAGTAGLPDVPQGGLPAPSKAGGVGAEPSGPVAGRGAGTYGTLGRLTPDVVLERAAREGNPSAIAELRRRREVEAAQGIVTPGYSPLGF